MCFEDLLTVRTRTKSRMHNIGSRWALSLVTSRVISPFIGVKEPQLPNGNLIGVV